MEEDTKKENSEMNVDSVSTEEKKNTNSKNVEAMPTEYETKE